MSIGKSNSNLEVALKNISKNFRKKIIKYYLNVRLKYSKGEYESAGMNAGKFCECILRFLQYELTNTNITFNKRITNFHDECLKLTRLPKDNGIEVFRIIIPRALSLLYTLRGKRGIGHVGGDVDANRIDSITILRITDWIICELVRIKHALSLEEAQDIVDSISDKLLPDVWEVAGKKIVIRHGLNTKQRALVLCYSCRDNAVLTEDLFNWVKYSNMTVFKSKILKPLDKNNQIHYDPIQELIYLSPLGIKEVEEKILA